MAQTHRALLSLSKNGNTWFLGEKPGDAALYTTAAPSASVLIGGGNAVGRPPAVTIGATDLSVQGTTTAAHVKSYGFTVMLPPGVDGSNDLSTLLASANHPGSNPYVWASNASVAARATADAAMTMAQFASNAVYSFSSIPETIEAVLWSSNQVAVLLDARDDALTARVEADYASNVAIVALRRADLASNAAYTALELTQVNTSTVTETAVYASNAATAASNAAFPASNLVFRYLPQVTWASDTATWASNTARVGSAEAFFASNIVAELSTEVQIASDKATSAYITATSAAGLAAWSSNAASLASKDALSAYHLAMTVSQKVALTDSPANTAATAQTAREAAYASNSVYVATSNSAAALTRTGVASNVLYPVRAQATFGSNAAGIAATTSTAASSAANAAVAAAAAANSNAARALVLAAGSVSSSAGGVISGDLRFGNVASIRGLVSLGVGTAAPQYPVHVTSTATEEDVSIWVSGQIQQLSDRRDKSDIARIDSALDKLMAIRGYTYRHRHAQASPHAGKPGGEGRFAGVLAQEVQASLPEAVHIHPETNQMSVSYNSLIPLLIEAIHELVVKLNIDTTDNDTDTEKDTDTGKITHPT